MKNNQIAIMGPNGRMGSAVVQRIYSNLRLDVTCIINEHRDRIDKMKPLLEEQKMKMETARRKSTEDGKKDAANKVPIVIPKITITNDLRAAYAADTAIFCLQKNELQQVLEMHGKEFEGKLLLYCDPYSCPDAISSMAGGSNTVQFMPSPLLYTNHYSFIPVCPSSKIELKKEDHANAILSALGKPFKVKQEEMQQYVVLIGMLPTIFISLAGEISKRSRITGADTLEIIRSMLLGTSKLLNEMNPEEMADVVKTDGGLANGVLKSLDLPLMVKKMFDEAERRFSK